ARLRDPGVMPASQVLEMATVGGARALGLDRVGRLEPGWSADMQLLDGAFPTPVNAGNLIGQIVLSRSGHHVESVMVAGSWRVRNAEVIDSDPEAQVARLHEQATRLWEIR
ncbi:MAG TPA: amidohydrolase family protein, partial [Acidimicrobiales bacterium]|nr:amidohydrolase family protein [Acidimicrobiales bacterium]